MISGTTKLKELGRACMEAHTVRPLEVDTSSAMPVRVGLPAFRETRD